MTRKESLYNRRPLTGNPRHDMFHELPLALVVYGYLHPVLPEDARLRVAKRIERIYMGCLGTLIGA